MQLPAEVSAVTGDFLVQIDARAPGLVTGLYLRGSLSYGEYFAGQSDIDFTAVLASRPDAAAVHALAAAHEAVHVAHPVPHFSGFHLLREDLAGNPGDCPAVPVMFEGSFTPATREYDINPVSWHELARQAVVVRGPALDARAIWTDDAALRAFTHANLGSYWARWPGWLTAHSVEAGHAWIAAWCVLGVSRLHHLLATGSMTSKSGAGRYALSAFGPRWQPIVAEALRIRERPDDPSGYGLDPAATRGRDVAAFTAMVVQAGLALGAGTAQAGPAQAGTNQARSAPATGLPFSR